MSNKNQFSKEQLKRQLNVANVGVASFRKQIKHTLPSEEREELEYGLTRLMDLVGKTDLAIRGYNHKDN